MKRNGAPGGARKVFERARNRDIAGIKADLELNAVRQPLHGSKTARHGFADMDLHRPAVVATR